MTAQSLWSERILCSALLLLLLLPLGLHARKFYEDDPIQKVPPPKSVGKVTSRKLSDYYDFFQNTFFQPGERPSRTKPIAAQEVNTLGEVPDSGWYTNRHYQHPLTIEELVRGPANDNAPSMDGPWKVVSAKVEGMTPGFWIEDVRGRRYNLKFDPIHSPEIATSADVISSKFFYALGYSVPENYVVAFDRKQLALRPGIVFRDEFGKARKMADRDITEILLDVPRSPDGKYRGMASLFIPGKLVGPFRYYGARSDDPNDVVPHERRRDLRGLSVFCAWLGHDDSRAINTLDAVVSEEGREFIRHYLIDFGSTLGSASTGPNTPRSGYEYLFSWKPAAVQFFTFGLVVPRWAEAKFPNLPSVGRFEAEKFDAERWVAEYPNPAFSHRLPDDAFWAAKQVMAFTDEQIRAIVKTGQYSDPEAEKWIADCLIARRDKIGKAFFAQVLPLDRFAIKEGQLAFEDLAVQHKLISSRNYTIQWSRFNNDTEQKNPRPNETTFALPRLLLESADGEYFSAEIHGGDPKKAVTAYLRKKSDRIEVVGVERTW